MSARTKQPTRTSQALRVGDHAVLRIAGSELPATVIEDRGNLGPSGERVLRIRVELGEGVESEYEVREEDLEPGVSPD